MRKPLLRIGSLLIIVSFATVVAPSVANAVPNAVGNASCKFTAGSGTFSPPLTATGTATVTKVKIKFKVNPHKDCSSSLTTPSGGTIKGLTDIIGAGKYTLSSGFADSCANFVANDSVKITVQTNWIGAPAVAPSLTKYNLGTGTVTAGPGAVITLNGPPGSAVTGSFSTPPNTGAKLVLVTSIPACSASVNVASFTITGSYTSFNN